MSECIFCRIVQDMAPAQILYRDDDVTAFRDVNPQAPVHILIVPNRHIARLADATPEDKALLGEMLMVARQLAEAEGIGDAFRLVVNNGARAGQSVFHVHLHLMGGRSFGWPPG